MSTDEYVPSECEVRADFVQTNTRNFDSYLTGRSLTSEQEHYGAQFDAMIARVRRDAAREALDGLYKDASQDYRIGLQGDDQERMDAAEAVLRATYAWMDRYPEETP